MMVVGGADKAVRILVLPCLKNEEWFGGEESSLMSSSADGDTTTAELWTDLVPLVSRQGRNLLRIRPPGEPFALQLHPRELNASET